MTRFRFTAWMLTLVGMAGVLLFGFRVLSRPREQRRTLEENQVRLEKQLVAVRRDYQSVRDDLTLAQTQLAKLPDSKGENSSAANKEQDDEIGAWLVSVQRLKKLFDDRPGQRIPEMRLLSDRDWMRLARTVEFDGEEQIRKTMAIVRNAATSHFVSSLGQSLQKFVEANGTNPPSSIMALAPYLKNPADADILSRFEIADRGFPPSNIPPHWLVRQIAPVDEDYDDRHETYARNGGGVGSFHGGAIAWIPDIQERSMHALQAFVAAHSGEFPSGLADALPYFNPPLDPIIAAKLIKNEQAQKQ